MKGRMRPYLPELTIRDYNTYMRYLRGVRRQMYKSYGFYACHLLRTNGVLFAILSDSLAGRMPTCKRQPGAGYAVPAQHDVPDAGHPAGGADGGGFFVEGGAVFVEQDLFLLELCREEESSVSRRRNSMR